MAGIDLDRTTWVTRVLGVDMSHFAPSGTTISPPKEPEGLRGRLNEIGLNLRQMAGTEDGPELTTRFREAVAALKASDWDTVEDILDDIEPAIVGGLSDARGQEAASVVRTANAWRNACGTLSTAIEGLKAQVLSTLRAEDEHTAEELDDIADELDNRLDPIVARLDAGLADQIDAAINGSSERQTTAMKKVLERIAKVEAEFSGDDIVGIVDGNGAFPIAISTTALGALAELRKALAERAGR